jgi:hypothetical protein
MLDGKAEVKAELIAERQFAPQLLVPLCRSHTWFVPHVREVSEFHATSSALSALITSVSGSLDDIHGTSLILLNPSTPMDQPSSSQAQLKERRSPRRELRLSMNLGGSLIVTKDHLAPEGETAYRRKLALCQQLRRRETVRAEPVEARRGNGSIELPVGSKPLLD